MVVAANKKEKRPEVSIAHKRDIMQVRVVKGVSIVCWCGE